MSQAQKLILTIGFLLILVSGLFPPWVQSWTFVAGGEDRQFRIESGAEGYSWIFQPPGVPDWVNRSFQSPDSKEVVASPVGEEISEGGMKVLRSSIRLPGLWRAQIDIRRLLIEWLIVAAGAFTGFVCAAKRKPE